MSLESSVAGPVRSWLQSSLGRKPGQAFVCPCLFCSGRHLFPRNVPCQSSKSDLVDPREKKISLHLHEEARVFQRQGQGVLGRSQGQFWAASVAPVFQAISVAPYSCRFPPPHQRQLGQLRTSPKHSLILPRFVPTHQGKLLALGADTLLSSQVSSQGSSRVKTEELVPAKLD